MPAGAHGPEDGAQPAGAPARRLHRRRPGAGCPAKGTGGTEAGPRRDVPGWGLIFGGLLGYGVWHQQVASGFHRICAAAGLGENWTPRELRHTFVSQQSDEGSTIEQIADAVGHSNRHITQTVYRHALADFTRHGGNREQSGSDDADATRSRSMLLTLKRQPQPGAAAKCSNRNERC